MYTDTHTDIYILISRHMHIHEYEPAYILSTHTYICVYMYDHAYIYTFNQYAHTHTWRHEYMHMPRNVLILITAHTHVYSHKDMHISKYTETCVHMYAHIYAQQRDMHIYKYTCIYSTYSYTLRHIHNFIYIHIWYAHIQTFLHTETCICSSIFTHIFAHLLRYYSYLHIHVPFPILLVLLFSELLPHSPLFLSFSVLSLRRTLLQGDQMPQFAQIKSEHPIFGNWCWDCPFISQWYPGVCDRLGWPPVGRPWC